MQFIQWNPVLSFIAVPTGQLIPPSLLHGQGPPGSGKTMLGVAVAGESGAHLVVLTGADVAAGEGAAQKLKDAFAEAQAHAPSVLLLDEVDVMCPARCVLMPKQSHLFC